nr:MAG TPA: hypothetical protein [Caudoviricetes sp.]
MYSFFMIYQPSILLKYTFIKRRKRCKFDGFYIVFELNRTENFNIRLPNGSGDVIVIDIVLPVPFAEFHGGETQTQEIPRNPCEKIVILAPLFYIGNVSIPFIETTIIKVREPFDDFRVNSSSFHCGHYFTFFLTVLFSKHS